MKIFFLTVIIALAGCLFSASAQSSNLSVAQVQGAIIGKWKVISLQREGEPIIDFSKDNSTWEFTADKDVIINSPDLGQFADKYRIIKSRFIRGAILIMIPELVNHGFLHEKLIPRKISDDGKTILMGDWNDSLLYTIRKID